MEVFKAVGKFTPPASENDQQCLLSFRKGDQFEVLDRTKSDWWGARRLNDNLVGYVPAKYLQFQERRIGKLLSDDYHEHRERQLKRFVAMQNSSHHKHPEELYSEVPEPVPDYQDEDSSEFPPPPPPIAGDSHPGSATPTSPSGGGDVSTATPTVIGVRNGAEGSPEDEGELIQPRKLFNPCVASRERQALHKELLLNYKLGKDVLQKPELNKILAKRKETQKKKEWEEMQANKRTSLELRLEEQANKLKEKEESERMKPIAEDDKAPEFVQMHRRITHKTPTSPPT